jgi:hypothetical protein
MRAIRIVELMLIGAALAAAAPLAAQAQTPASPKITAATATGPGTAAAATSAEVTATVVAVDFAHRAVTLKRADGEVSTIDVGEQVRNFDQIKVGDTVRAKYTRALVLELKKGPAAQGAPTEEHAITPAPTAGAKPGGGIARKVTAVADVVAVDPLHQLVTLRGPGGNEVDLNVRDPKQLANIQKGDHVLVTYVEAVAISVESTMHSASAK